MTSKKSPADTEGSNRTLEVIAEEIRAKRESTTCIIDIGGLLKEAKEGVEHGKWLEWLEQELDYSKRTAERYLKAFEFARSVKSDTVTDFGLLTPTALYLLSEDAYWRTNHCEDYRDDATDAVLDVIRRGEKVDRKRAERIIEEVVAKYRAEDETDGQADAGVGRGTTQNRESEPGADDGEPSGVVAYSNASVAESLEEAQHDASAEVASKEDEDGVDAASEIDLPHKSKEEILALVEPILRLVNDKGCCALHIEGADRETYDKVEKAEQALSQIRMEVASTNGSVIGRQIEAEREAAEKAQRSAAGRRARQMSRQMSNARLTDDTEACR